ncbi:MAG: OsmC family protein [Betaproteobacteria bacterium]|nr:OsmC family protein [Betaproteobacteria bacterium]MCL2885427.1 OsmC family protein [Betaproteobacteria bacterium]
MIHTKSQAAKFQVQVTNGTQFSMADTSPDKGGGNAGFRPHELLEAALASCMNMSLRMYAEKHSFPLSGVSVSVSLNRANPGVPSFEYSAEFEGPLSEAQRSQLLTVLENCPVRSTLSKPLQFKLHEQSLPLDAQEPKVIQIVRHTT